MRRPTLLAVALSVALLCFAFAACGGKEQAAPVTLGEARDASASPLPTPGPPHQFTHSPWGISFTYPGDWSLYMPDFDALERTPVEVPPGYTYNPDFEQMRLLGYGITLFPTASGSSAPTKIEIALNSVTLSPGVPLEKYVDLSEALSAIENPLANQTTLRKVDVSARPYAHVADQVMYTILENPYVHIETVWLAKGDLVYTFMTYSADPSGLQVLEQVVTSLQFDPIKMAAVRAKAHFQGNEELIAQQIDGLQPPPTPECDIVCRDQKAYDSMMTTQAAATPAPISPLATPPPSGPAAP